MVIICSQCGSQAEDDMRFCSVCGAPLRVQRTSTSTTTPSTSINPRNISNSQVNHSTRRTVSQPTVSHDISAPSLFESLEKAKTKNGNSNNTPKERRPNSRAVKKSTPTPEIVARPNRPSRQKMRQDLKVPTRSSDLPPEKVQQLRELLRSLNKLDKLLEASAILSRDGTILTSAVSDKYNNQVMSMVAMNIFDIAIDSIKALSGGSLKLLTLNADNALVMLSWINSKTVLILITSPKSQVGLISMYSQLVSQKIATILNSM